MQPGQVRLLLVRHAESANKKRRPGQRASADPGLTDHGHQQAEELGKRLSRDLRPLWGKTGKDDLVVVVSSPMKRCLLTILPAVHRLMLAPGSCLCHGGSYEYGCAGQAQMGSTPAEIAAEFPEFSPVGFGDGGMWDYRGENAKESEKDCKERITRLLQWVHFTVAAELRARAAGTSGAATVILVTHQTVADLICQQYLDGSDDKWAYGDIKYKLQNAGITELFLNSDGQATIGRINDCAHLIYISNQRLYSRKQTCAF